MHLNKICYNLSMILEKINNIIRYFVKTNYVDRSADRLHKTNLDDSTTPNRPLLNLPHKRLFLESCPNLITNPQELGTFQKNCSFFLNYTFFKNPKLIAKFFFQNFSF